MCLVILDLCLYFLEYSILTLGCNMFYQWIFIFIYLAAMCVCVCVCVCARACVRMRACKHVHTHCWVHIELWSVWSVLRDLWWWFLGSIKPVTSIASKQYHNVQNKLHYSGRHCKLKWSATRLMCIWQDKRVLTCIILDFYAVVHQTFWYFHLLVSCIGIVMKFYIQSLGCHW
jgi:hypothetical protein